MRMSLMGMQLGLWRLLASGSSLLNGLVSYWPLNETSGVRNDVVGTNHLTDNNTVGSVISGPEGTVASFVGASNESLTVADNASLDVGSTGNGATLSVWFKPTGNSTGYGMIIGRGWGGDRPIEISTENNSISPIYTRVEAGNSAQGVGAIPTTEWTHIAAVFNPTDKKLYTYLNGVFINSTAALTNSSLDASNQPLEIGGSATAGDITGQLAHCGMWDRNLSAEEITSLFNSGRGKRYADLTTAEKVGLVSYWNLDEQSGVRYDSHGTNHLTDNNTVLAVNRGPLGTVAAYLAANLEALYSTRPTLDFTQGVSCALWGKTLTGAPANHAYFSFGLPSGNGGLGQIVLSTQGSGNTSMIAMMTDSVGNNTAASKISAIDLWHFYVMRYSPATRKVSFSVDGATPTVASTALTNHPEMQAANRIAIGATCTNTALATYTTSNISRFGVWNRELSDADITALFAAGNGRSYAELTTADKTSLVSYWNLDEGSGVRYDSHGSNNLTDNNTVGSVINAGDAMDGVAASFVTANSEYLSIGDPFQHTTFTVSGWYYVPDAALSYALVSRNSAGARQWEVTANQSGSNTRCFFYANDTDVVSADTPTNSQALSTWHHFVAWFDGAAYTCHIQVDGGTIYNSTVNTGPIPDTAIALNFGRRVSGVAYLNGRLDEVAIWSRILTAGERAELYSAGAGKFYSFS